MADDAAPPPDPAFSTPYLVQLHDGSTATYYVHTDRPPTQGEVAQYAASQGQRFAGFAPPPAQAAPAPDAAAPVPSLARRAWDVIAPERSLTSQLPSIGGATAGGLLGATYGAPFFPPVGSIVGGLGGAIIGGMGGEAAQYGGEQLAGTGPAEEGTFTQRVGAAGVRSGVGELGGQVLRAPVAYVAGKVMPVAEAATELAPVLTGTATRAAEGHGAAQQLAARAANALPDWWAQNAAGKTAGEIVAAWPKTVEEQLQIAGDRLPQMQTIMGAIQKGAVPWSQTVGPWGSVTGAGGLYRLVTGAATPYELGAAAAIPAYDVAAQAGNKFLSSQLLSPSGLARLSWLPTIGDYAGPLFQTATRFGAQSVAQPQSPAATTIWP